MNHPNESATRRDLRFDALIRAYHAESLRRLSPRVAAQLAQRRNAALRGQSSAKTSCMLSRRQMLATGLAAVCALALGLRFMPTQPQVAPADSATMAAATTTLDPAHDHASQALATALDEDPDFYAWLGSADARQVALE